MGPAACHFATGPFLEKSWVPGPRHLITLEMFFFLHPQPIDKRTKEQHPNSEQESASSLCIPVLAPLSLCKPDQEDNLPSHRLWHMSGRCAKLRSPGLPATHCSLPGSCLPRCLKGRCSRGAIWQDPMWLHHPSSSSCELPTFGMAG